MSNPRLDIHGCAMGDSQWLQSFLDGELTPPRHAAQAAHVEQCAACAAALGRLIELDRLVVEVRPCPLALTPAASRALLDRALAEAGVRRGGWGRGWLALAWGFAAALVLVGSGIASEWWRPDMRASHVGAGSRPSGALAQRNTRVRSVEVAGGFEQGTGPHPLSPSPNTGREGTKERTIPRSFSPGIGESERGERAPAKSSAEHRPTAGRQKPGHDQNVPPVPQSAPPSELRPRRAVRRRYRFADARLGGDTQRAKRSPKSDGVAGRAKHERSGDDLLAKLPSTADVALGPPEPETPVPEGGTPAEQAVALLPDVNPAVVGAAVTWDGLAERLARADAGMDGGTTAVTGSSPGEASNVSLQPPAPQLLVLVTSEPAPSPVAVTEAPEDAPSYARAVALRPDANGASLWTQATASSDGTETKLALVMLGSDPWAWEGDE